MVDPTTPAPAAAPAPNASPAPTSGPTPTTAPSNPNVDPTKTASTPPAVTNEPGVKAGTVGNKSIARGGAGLITNPTPIADPDAPPPAEKRPDSVPQSTIDEMNAGAEALKRNKPVATALEQARKDKDEASSDKA
jgi:hypothetical protein